MVEPAKTACSTTGTGITISDISKETAMRIKDLQSVGIFLFVVLLLFWLFWLLANQNQGLQEFPPEEYCKSSTSPSLIECDFARGKINKEERFLYLYYALWDYEKLPAQYNGTFEWEGTTLAAELYFEKQQLIKSGEICKFSKFTRNELRIDVDCGTLSLYRISKVIKSIILGGFGIVILIYRKRILQIKLFHEVYGFLNLIFREQR